MAKKDKKRPAHEVILDEMKRLCDSEHEEQSTERFAELCTVMNEMIIPQDKIDSITGELKKLVLETLIYEAPSFEETTFEAEAAKKVGMAQFLLYQLKN